MRGKGITVLLLGLLVLLGGCAWLVPPSPPVPPATAPQNLAASFGTSRAEIALTWSPVEGATYYEVQRGGTHEGPWDAVGSSNTSSFVNAVGEANEGKWFWYRVRACNAAGCGPWSEPVRGYAGRPPAPENVRASQGDYNDRIVITWDPVPGADYYHVFRDRVREGTYPVVAQNVTETSIEDKEVSPATWYWYKVQACKESVGCSFLSEPAGGYRGPYPVPFGNGDEG